MQVGRAAKLGALAELFAQRFMARRRGEEAIEQRAQVEACSATDDGQAAALRDLADGLAGEAAVVSGGAGLVGRGDVDEVVRDAGALGQGGLGCADLHAAIDGDGVAGDDFAGESLGEGEGKRGLAAGGGAGDDDERRELLGFARGLPKPPPACGEDAMHAGAENGEDNGGEGEQEQAAKLAAAYEVFGCVGRLCFARVGGVGWVHVLLKYPTHAQKLCDGWGTHHRLSTPGVGCCRRSLRAARAAGRGRAWAAAGTGLRW